MKLPVACQADPPLTLYSYVPYPPAAPVIVMVPSSAPLQVMLVEATLADIAEGSVIIRLGLIIRKQFVLTTSLILTSYEPGARLIKSGDPSQEMPPFIEN